MNREGLEHTSAKRNDKCRCDPGSFLKRTMRIEGPYREMKDSRWAHSTAVGADNDCGNDLSEFPRIDRAAPRRTHEEESNPSNA
jgi:hypothetical protein